MIGWVFETTRGTPETMVSVFVTLLWASETVVCLFVALDVTGCTPVYPKFSLGAGGRWWSYRSDRTHIKDTPNPVEVQAPGGNHLFIVLHTVAPRDQILFVSLDDVPLDLIRSPG